MEEKELHETIKMILTIVDRNLRITENIAATNTDLLKMQTELLKIVKN